MFKFIKRLVDRQNLKWRLGDLKQLEQLAGARYAVALACGDVKAQERLKQCILDFRKEAREIEERLGKWQKW